MFLNSSFYCSYGDYQDIPDETTLELAFIESILENRA